jgi:glycosyltransferase involved in cell wall biosynthesis
MTTPPDASPSIVIVLPSGLIIGGVEVWAVRLAARLAVNRRVVLAVYPPVLGLPEQLVPPNGVEVIRCPQPDWGGVGPTTAAAVRAVLPATLLVSHSTDWYAAVADLCRDDPAGVRVIGYCHGYDSDVFDALERFEPAISRFVAVSDECAAELVRRLPGRATDVRVRSCSVAVQPLADRKYTGPGEPLRILYAGRVTDKAKRVTRLPQLAAELFARTPAFELRIVGDGPEEAALADRIGRLPAAVRGRIRREPAVPPAAVSGLLGWADVAVLVSSSEGSSLFMLEAMAAGCVPVMTDVSGTRAAIEDGVTGYRTPVDDLGAMADRLAALAADRRRLAEMGRAARRRAASYSDEAYSHWLAALEAEAWADRPREWPAGRRAYPWHQRMAFAIGSRLPGVRAAWRRVLRALR